ncbi:Cna B-type domain-containing protein [Bacillus wiedmannii]|uniref:Cna B-type domain-containing protein n=1 Tax=Bacillus wiedmannii TaxID=1890302 RepID=UPI001C03439E|nr:Cna B-type domain-containing protein [Bacillus wiedmannii]QWI19607.1 Cna B-type domain-containing protein [Bacillus wiedmannii]
MYLKRITSIFSIIMIFMFTIGQSLLPIVANAQELNTAGLVDSFKIDKTDLYVGQRTKVTVNFSEKDGLKLKPGDTLTLTLPPELKGLNKEFPLDDYGTCKVTAGTVVCTFNDKVSTHQNIKGYLNFFVEAANVGTDEKKEIETNFGTNVDKQSVTITGPSSGGGGTDPGKPPFFYKTGDMNSGKDDEVRWFLNINLAKEELSRDIVVTDNLQEGQTLNKDSFYISIDDNLGRRSLTLQEFEQQGYGKITFTGDKSFKVVLNKDKARLAAFTIGYTSTITEAGKKQEFFKNDYTIDYQVLNEKPVTESGTHPVENMTAGGGAEGNVTPRGTLRIVKHIEGDEEKVIPNVSFKLYKESNEQVGDVYTTDEKGIIEIPNLQPGKYYVKEVSAPDYVDFDPQAKIIFEVKSDAVNGVKLPIPNKVKTTSIAGTKTWKGDNEKDRPSSIKVELLQNEKVVDTKEVTAADGWKYKFDNLPAYDANGVAYKYEVKEQPIDGYTTEVNGYDITNTKVVQTTKVEGTKTWKDGNAQSRPTMIKVDLLQNGTVIATQEVSEATGWKYEFKDLAINDVAGKAYKYEVKEQPVDGYESKVNGYDITNTKVGKTSVAGTKTWKGGTEEEHKAIKVDLLQNGTVIATQEVSKETGWKYEFKDLVAFDENGKAYKYEVKEQSVDGYESKVNGYDITNTKVGETKVEGTKTWKDDNATDRPEMIKVDLLQNGKVVDTKDVTVATNWKYTFEKLQAYDAEGKAYKYEVKEQAVPGYESKVNGTDITNTKVGETKVEGTKMWNDNNATDRPSSIKVELLQNGKVVDTKEVTAATEWKYTFEKLQAYDANGVAYKYEVKEQAVPGYESKVSGTDITNTKVGKTKVEGTKAWNDGNATDRPTIIKVDLLQNGNVIQTHDVLAVMGWKYIFADLEAYDAEGKAYEYTVKEQPVPGYESKVSGTDITNTKVGQTKVEGTKTWKDDNATDRPEMIRVDLLQNGTVIATQEVSKATDWKYEFKDLAAYDVNGVAYKYEVKEQPIAGYESKVRGYDITNTKVGETKVEGTKTWNDNNATDRPSSIKVDLLQNGKVIDTKEVSKATNWKYTFEKLQAYDANGAAYKYEVKEQPVPGYESKVSGTDITNTKVGKTKVEGTKAWNDGNATDRPTIIKVDLLQNGNVIQTHDVLAVMGWKYIFADLEAYDAEGKAYEYTVKEQPVPGYESKVSGTDITNTKVGQTKVEGTKTWKDDNATDRPEMIRVDLLQNGTVIATQEVSKATDWKYEFKDLAAYDVNGVAYKYEVKEQPIAGYESKVRGYDITNTKVGETKVEGTKTWNDNNATDRPSSIKVDLLQNGKVIDTKEVSKATNWKYTFEKLQAYDANGAAYKYEVKEQPVPGYESKVSGTDITNIKVGETKVEGTKTWKDDNAKDRPSSIKVDLLQNGTVIATQEVSKATDWKYEFKDLAAYDAEGKAYKYEVKEQAVPGYESKVNGTDITNTKVGETKVEGTKTWKDDNAKDRPSSIKVDLLQNGKVIDTKEVSKATNWKYTFEKLQAYDANGAAYKYEVKEQPVPGYESKVSGTDITNIKVGETKVEGTKTWNDNNATDRPSSIKVDLLQNGKVVDTKEVTAATNWKYTFEKLQAYDAEGKAYKYEVKEQPVAGYESKVNGTDITNTKVGKTKVEGKKTWKDDNATDRPEMIKVDLLQNGTVIATQEVSKVTDWKYEFKDLAAYDAEGKVYKYEVKEQTVPGYESKVSGTDITNTKVGETKVEGTKTWNDNNATDRPSTIKVDLLQNGKVVDTKEVTVETNWKYTFEKLQAYDAEGKAYKYEVKEQAVEGYKSKVNGYDITNTKVGETKVEGTKTWNDNNATDRPSSIKVDLLQNGKVIDTKEVSKATNWKYTFEKLQAYDTNGVAYKYEVKEQQVDGYKSEVKDYDITNTKVGETKVEGTKTWNDNNATDRPSSIKVDLLQNGKVIDTKEVSKATNWKYTFEKLQAYDENGVAYKYEVKEQQVDGYKSEVKDYDITNTKVGETKVEGTKTWKDDNATNRPSTIKVDLLQNGKVVDTKEVTAETNWKYTFEKLQAYDANGVAYKYEVKEQPVAGYESKVSGTDITNTKVGKTKVEGTKTWNDGNATDRPTMIKVDLLQNGNVIQTHDVLAVMGWKYIFADLEAYDAEGKAYEYTVKEQPVAGYESKVSGTDITNTKVGQTKVEGTKTWKDDNATDRPEMIKVDLLQNGTVIATQEVSKATGWKYEFKDLVAYDANGVAYKYEVKEQPIAGYKSEVKGTDIANTKVGETKVEGTKTWNDNNATDRPSSIKVDLLQNGKVVDTKEVTAETNWKYTFEKLQAYDVEGKAYKYEVKEQAVPGYESKVSGTDITNTKVGKTKVEGTKTWKDDNATDRPEMIKVDLLQNGTVIATQEVSKATGWKYEFKDLAAYDANGVAYKYEVKEQPVAGYKSEVKGYDITNTKIKDKPNVDPKDPSTDPKDPSTDPKNPNTNTGSNGDSKVPPTTENDKPTLLPNTGGTSAGMSSIFGGMVLFLLGGILLARQRIK